MPSKDGELLIASCCSGQSFPRGLGIAGAGPSNDDATEEASKQKWGYGRTDDLRCMIPKQTSSQIETFCGEAWLRTVLGCLLPKRLK